MWSILLRDPLLHFLLLGGLLFMLYAAFGRPDGTTPRDRIVVGESELMRLSQQFQRTWMRPPTRSELQGLADDFVKEEILYREALALGLDRDDLVIRRRMRQKMEFLNADLSERQPNDEQLEAYLQTNRATFREPPRFSFEQVYLDPQRTDGDATDRAHELLEVLRAAGHAAVDPAVLGDATLLPAAMADASPRDIANTFGPDFANAVASAPPGAWSGPSRSAYGLHLLRVTETQPGRLPPLDAIRRAVAREWANERRQEAEARFYEALRTRYSIEIHWPQEADVDAPPTGPATSGPVAGR